MVGYYLILFGYGLFVGSLNITIKETVLQVVFIMVIMYASAHIPKKDKTEDR